MITPRPKTDPLRRACQGELTAAFGFLHSEASSGAGNECVKSGNDDKSIGEQLKRADGRLLRLLAICSLYARRRLRSQCQILGEDRYGLDRSGRRPRDSLVVLCQPCSNLPEHVQPLFPRRREVRRPWVGDHARRLAARSQDFKILPSLIGWHTLIGRAVQD